MEGLDMEPQQEVAAIGYFLLRQRAEEVGMYDIQDFNPSSVATWEDYHEHFWADFRSGERLEGAEAVYRPSLNMITSSDGGRDASLANFTHEMAHFVSSPKNLPAKAENTKRVMKTGFDSLYSENGTEDADYFRASFRLFNEGVTEMISHDLCDDMTLEELGALYKGLFPVKAQKNLDHAKEDYQEWLQKIKPIEKTMQEKELAEFPDFIKKETDAKRIEMYTKAHEGRMGQWQRMRNAREQDLKKMEVLPIESGDPLKNKDDVAYVEMVDLVSKMLDGVALKNAANLVLFDEARTVAWKNLQKAYFSGNTPHLKVFESVYGEGFLRKIATLDYRDANSDSENQTMVWKEYDEIKSIIESVNAGLRK